MSNLRLMVLVGTVAAVSAGLFACASSDPIAPEASAYLVTRMVAQAEQSHIAKAGSYGAVDDLIASGDLEKSRFEVLKARAVGFRFALAVDEQHHSFTFTSLPASGDSWHALFVDQTGVVRKSRSGEDPKRGDPFR
jgi:hypothetical protein